MDRLPYLLLTALLVAAPTVHGESQAETDKQCGHIGGMAEQVMKWRQGNAAAQEIIDKVRAADTIPEDSKPLIRDMVRQAYRMSRYDDRDNQQRLIREFENRYYLLCLSAVEFRDR